MLTTLSRLKDELNVTNHDNDSYFLYLIKDIGKVIESYCGRTFRRTVASEAIFFSPWDQFSERKQLFLRHYPVLSVSSVIITYSDGTVAELEETTDFYVDTESGTIILFEVPSSDTRRIDVSYTGGYVLPDDANPTVGPRTLPEDIERAVLELCKLKYFARMRDPAIRAERVPDVYDISYFSADSAVGREGSINSLMAPVDPYRDMRLDF